jgi:hypothetical protein
LSGVAREVICLGYVTKKAAKDKNESSFKIHSANRYYFTMFLTEPKGKYIFFRPLKKGRFRPVEN